MNLKNNKKKKGFTLIELVIVLAVLAIIALIAIPNFTKVRNDSLLKSDFRSAEQIKKITLMAISNETVVVPAAVTTYTLKFNEKNFDTAGGTADFDAMLKDVKAPQVTGASNFLVKIDTSGNVTVSYDKKITIDKVDYEVLAK